MNKNAMKNGQKYFYILHWILQLEQKCKNRLDTHSSRRRWKRNSMEASNTKKAVTLSLNELETPILYQELTLWKN